MKYAILCLSFSYAVAFNYHGCALAPDNLHGWVVYHDTTLILYTTNGGVSWTEQSVPPSALRFFDVTCVDELNAWTCGVLGQVLHTANGGIDWIPQVIGLSKYSTRIEFIDLDHGWAACGDGAVGFTVNGGSYWDQSFCSWCGAEFYGVSFVNPLDGWIVAGFPDSLLIGQGYIAPSTDGGANWDTLRGYHTLNYEEFFDVHFFNLLEGVVVGGDEMDTSALIWKTTDGGMSWVSINPPSSSYYLRALDFVGNEGWAVGRFGTIIYSNDNGNTWNHQNSPTVNTLFDIEFSDSLHGIACGNNTILYTIDGGQNWYESSVSEYNKQSLSKFEIHIFPNPFNNILKFTLPEGANTQICIYDCKGALIQQMNCTESVQWIPGSLLPAGVYFIQIINPEQSGIRKVIKLR